MTLKSWRVGLAGCGWAGSHHAEALKSLTSRARLIAAADADAARVEAFARDHHIPEWSADYRDLLDKQKLDAIILALPHDLHAEAAIAAAGAGLHVLIEKPLANTLAEADAMIEAFETADVRLMVGENVRYDATYLKAVELIKAGAVGDVFLVRLTRETNIHDYLRKRPWFLSDPTAGVTYTGGIHEFDLLRMLAGEIDHVYALAAPKALPEMAGDDTNVIAIGMKNGISALIVESFSIRTPEPGIHGIAHGRQGSLWFHGNRLRLYNAAEDGHPDQIEEFTLPPQDTFETEISHFLDCLDDGSQPLTNGRESRKPLAAVLATRESLQRGERVRIL